MIEILNSVICADMEQLAFEPTELQEHAFDITNDDLKQAISNKEISTEVAIDFLYKMLQTSYEIQG